jgi:hypothetical protein
VGPKAHAPQGDPLKRYGRLVVTSRAASQVAKVAGPWWPEPSTEKAGALSEGSSSTGRAPVSKTGGWGFESLLPCSDGRDEETPKGKSKAGAKQ